MDNVIIVRVDVLAKQKSWKRKEIIHFYRKKEREKGNRFFFLFCKEKKKKRKDK